MHQTVLNSTMKDYRPSMNQNGSIPTSKHNQGAGSNHREKLCGLVNDYGNGYYLDGCRSVWADHIVADPRQRREFHCNLIQCCAASFILLFLLDNRKVVLSSWAAEIWKRCKLMELENMFSTQVHVWNAKTSTAPFCANHAFLGSACYELVVDSNAIVWRFALGGLCINWAS